MNDTANLNEQAIAGGYRPDDFVFWRYNLGIVVGRIEWAHKRLFTRPVYYDFNPPMTRLEKLLITPDMAWELETIHRKLIDAVCELEGFALLYIAARKAVREKSAAIDERNVLQFPSTDDERSGPPHSPTGPA